MALVEAEILSAENDGTSIVVGVLYRSDGIEHSKEIFRFSNLTGLSFSGVTDSIVARGREIKHSLEAVIEVKKLINTKITIQEPE